MLQYKYSMSNTENGYLMYESAYVNGKQYNEEGLYTGTDKTYVFTNRDEMINWLRDNGFAKQEEAQAKE